MLMAPPPSGTAPPFANRQQTQLLAQQPGIGGMKFPGSIISAANSLGPQQPQMAALLKALQSGGNRLGV